MADGSSKQRYFWAFIGSNAATGITLFKLDSQTGVITDEGMAAETNAPGFLHIAPNQKFLYAGVKMAGPTTQEAGIEAFSINGKTGKLTSLNKETSGGGEATFVTVDPSGKNVLVAHYGTATVSVLPIGADGKVGARSDLIKQVGTSVDPQRQTRAYAHAVNVDPSGKVAITCDLGADKLFMYDLNVDAGKITPHNPPAVSTAPGSGPRHLTFSPNGKFAYVVTEMGATVITYSWDAAKGNFTELQTVKTLPDDFKGTNTSAEVQLTPDGRFLYASNRIDSNFLTIFSVDQATGKLTLVGYQPSGGRIPRNFRIDPTGQFMIVANQESNNIVLFKINKDNGTLYQYGGAIDVRSPICVKFLAVEQ